MKDLGLLLWLLVVCIMGYSFGERAILEHWSLLRWIAAIYFVSLFAGPLFALAYIRWFKGED
jgi:membrane protein DedA with SNARE-associated domain